ncbi:MAG: cardiolipin synthase B [Pseudaminobacter sp.]|nr:cardiolipin synthase B [Pseudaminobacter sp.]
MKWLPGLRFVFGAVFGAAALIVALNLMPEQHEVRRPVPHAYAAADPQFVQTMSGVYGGGAEQGHLIDTLVNGDEIFPSMLGAIEAARSTINFETYIYWSGEIGLRFAETLAAKARDGIEVRVLVDWAGSIPFDQRFIDLMEQAGVSFHRFRPPRWYTLDRINNRTHRKLLVVDGLVGFTGGVGIGDEWLGDARNADEWRDTHYRIVGPAVAAMQAAFSDNWLEATGEVLQGGKFYPPHTEGGAAGAQMVVSSEGALSMHQMMLMALAAAESHIRIGMAYFVPDDVALAQLLAARARGVQIDIIVPSEKTDVPLVRKGSRHFWGELLRAGARIHEFQPTMYHPKLLIVDDGWASVGSANLDERSLRLNDEANLNVYDKNFTARQIAIFENDLEQSRSISLEEWEARPLWQKFTDWLASLLRAQI